MFNVEAGLEFGRAAALQKIPHVHQGRSQAGMDCSGLTLGMLDAAGWVARDPDNTLSLNYTRLGSWVNIQRALDNEGYQIPLEAVLPMDFLVIHWPGYDVPQHFAAVSSVSPDGIYIIHTHQTLLHASQHRLTKPLQRRIYCSFRFFGRLDDDPLNPYCADLRSTETE